MTNLFCFRFSAHRGLYSRPTEAYTVGLYSRSKQISEDTLDFIDEMQLYEVSFLIYFMIGIIVSNIVSYILQEQNRFIFKTEILLS